MSNIDPTARVEDGAVIAADVSIGPFCLIGPNVRIGEGCRLISHVNIVGHTTIKYFVFLRDRVDLRNLILHGLGIDQHIASARAVNMTTGTVDVRRIWRQTS